MDNVIEFVITILIVIALLLCLYWGLWLLWTWVVPQVFPAGPTAIIAPGFWQFVGMLLLAKIIGGAIFGSSK